MALRHQIGMTRVWLRGDGAAFVLHPDVYRPLIDAWAAFRARSWFARLLGGGSVYRTRDLYSAAVCFDLRDVAAVGFANPRQIQIAEDDDKAEDDRDEAWRG